MPLYTYKGQVYTMHKHPLYSTWKSMNERCYRKYKYSHGDYYGRVKVCLRWLRPCFGGLEPDPFKNFCDDMGERPERATLDRIDPNGDYCPENCRWARADVQGHNKLVPASCIGIKYTYGRHRDGTKYRTKYYRISIRHKGKIYTQHIKKGETAQQAFATLKERVKPALDDWDVPRALQ